MVRRHTNWKETSENTSLRKEGSLKENLCRTKPAKRLKLPSIEKYLGVPSNDGTPVSHVKNFQSIFKAASRNEDVKGVVKDYGFGSKAGRQVNVKTKVNQDSIIVDTKIGNDWYLFGVADGHGQFGEQVSGFVKTTFPHHLRKCLKERKELEAVQEAFRRTSDDLSLSPINTYFSGSTFSCVLITQNRIITGNLGDSRSILCSVINGREHSRALTVDHKPSVQSEFTRITNAGGIVGKFVTDVGEEYGPYRVWLKDERSPGLAMSRSFGDIVATSIGVTAEPDVEEVKIRNEDKALVVGSDGVWDKLSNEEVARIVFSCENADVAASEIIMKARRRWEKAGPIIDDISCIVIKLSHTN
eukprot:TRINITY_DN8625_c0_g1_i9.p1 TRINITY_DN8625_c0_g1~~TRINITY_DN8625_c0_g1_i9.p1  ORF type:complete len:358 (-),score=54.73 TRINITY_DN8625_c0_g1_i9:66-1139(-)